MLEKKYIIIICMIVCLLILYYFYSEISRLKELVLPSYQKIMLLETKVTNLEKKTTHITSKKTHPKLDSPALSITYQSDMVRQGHLSAKYAEISETEAKELAKKIEPPKSKILQGEFSEPQVKQQQIKENKADFENSDTINIKIADLIKRKSTNAVNSQTSEYQTFLDDLDKNMEMNALEEDTLDSDMIKSITESIQYADVPSENTLSDISSAPAQRKKKANSSAPARTKKKSNKKLTK